MHWNFNLSAHSLKMSYNGTGHRYLLPSVVSSRLRGKTAGTGDLDPCLSESPPPLKGTVYLLGVKYDLPRDGAAFVEDLQSRFWFTYRKNFRPIGDTGYTSDSGWGCTLRCGQMLLGHALLLRHLGRDWRWNPARSNDYKYQKILRMFLDYRDSEYSIQMIALQGADFGRSVGQWFGPNNVAQAIKRLAVHDQWSEVAVYVAMDMLVVIDDIKALARQSHGVKGSVEVTTIDGEHVPTPVKTKMRSASSDPALNEDFEILTEENVPDIVTKSVDRTKLRHYGQRSYSRSYDPSIDASLLNLTMEDIQKQCKAKREEDPQTERTMASQDEATPSVQSNFRPILVFIPLRLGQERFNMEYKEAVKACFAVKQSVGIIGGKPRHALWFTGYHDDYLIYLDPHKTQSCVTLPDAGGIVSDSSYHTTQIERLHISELDPSLALGFFCQTEADLDDLCDKLRSDVLSKMKYLFELTRHRPAYWGPLESADHLSKEPFILLQVEKNSNESDEGFELVDWPYPIPEPVTTPPDPMTTPPR